MNKEEFQKLIKQGTQQTIRKVDWDKIVKQATESGKPYTFAEFYTTFINDMISIQRTKAKLNELYLKKKVAKVNDGRRNYWCFDPEIIKLQHG